MKPQNLQRYMALFGVFAVAACAETDVEMLLEELTPEEQLELAVLEDPAAFAIALELADEANAVALDMGAPRATAARDYSDQARASFEDARDAMNAGDGRLALDAVRDARRYVARGMRELGGDEALEDAIERLEDMALTVTDELFADASMLGAQLDRITSDSRAMLANGDSVGAAARAVLGEQVVMMHRSDRTDVGVDRARLAVALAGTSVALAERIINAQDRPAVCDVAAITDAVTDRACRQNRWLRLAKRQLAVAERALSNGRLRRAVHFAQHAHWSALKAVILPGGIHREEIEAIRDLAIHLYEEAEAHVGDDAVELKHRLLNHAADLIERGTAMLEEGKKRGVAPLWRAAVISRWLLG